MWKRVLVSGLASLVVVAVVAAWAWAPPAERGRGRPPEGRWEKGPGGRGPGAELYRIHAEIQELLEKAERLKASA